LLSKLCRVSDTPCGTGLYGILRCLLEIKGMRPDQYGTTTGCRLDEVLSTEWQQASTDKGQISESIVSGHFAHAVAQPDLGRGLGQSFTTPPKLAMPSCLQQGWRRHQQSAAGDAAPAPTRLTATAKAAPRGENASCLFTFACARRQPDLTACRQALHANACTKLNPFFRVRGRRQIL
jgi:hypothetical protein